MGRRIAVNPDWRDRYELAIEAAEDAGKLALAHFDTGLAVEWKQDASPVTVADREAEHLLRQRISAKFPEDGLLGEEHGASNGSSGYRWIIDPIDGTRNYVRGIPIWATLVGLEYQGQLVAGVARVPAMNMTYRALRGDGAYRDSRRIHVSSVDRLADAQLFYSSISWFVKAGCKDAFLQVAGLTQRQRGFGDFYGYVLVAQGAGELMVEHGVHAWDIAALVPIVEEAGGRISNWDGGLDIERPDVVVSNGRLHEDALEILRMARPLASVKGI
jgi:histidinol-phosphatase